MYLLYEETNESTPIQQQTDQQSSQTVVNIVTIVLDDYRKKILEKLQTVEEETKKTILEILDYFLDDIILGSLKYSDKKKIEYNQNIGAEIGELVKLYVENVLSKQHGITDKSVNGIFFQNYGKYDEDVEFLKNVASVKDVNYRSVINKYVIENYEKIGKTISDMIRVPIESTNPTPEQQKVRQSIVEELKKNPVTKYALEFVKDQAKSVVSDIRNDVRGYIKDRVMYRAFDYALDSALSGLKKTGSFIGSLFQKGFSLLKRKKLYELLVEDSRESKSNFLRRIWNSFKSIFEYFFVKKKTLGFAILGGIVLTVAVSGLSVLYKPFGFIFRIIKKVLQFPIKLLGSFFKSKKTEELLEEIVYNKKKRKIYYDKVKRITKLVELYSSI